MKEFKGISASPGIAIGKAFLYIEDNFPIPNYTIQESDIPDELERFFAAEKSAAEEIQNLKAKNAREKGAEEVKFLDSHLLMLNDPSFHELIETKLRATRKNVEFVLYQEIEELTAKLRQSQDQYLRERTIDIYDVSRRVLNHLLYRDMVSLSDLEEDIILVTHNLMPSDAIDMDKRKVRGIAMDVGGRTSHTAILARSFEIPAVLGLSDVTKYARTGDEILIDGNKGTVILNPDAQTREKYLKSRQEWERREVQLLSLNELRAETKDGKLIELNANIEVPEEVDSAIAHGADGIGLYRSEFLFLKPGRPASLHDQYEAYSYVLRGMKGKSVIIRTLDVGGDKIIPDIEELDEKNPILGWRAVRFCLSNVGIFKTQLKAMLMASVHGNMKIMFPMISGIEELTTTLEIVEEVKDELRKEGTPFNDPPIGIMIEVPSAALTSDILAKKVQFFSLGTNDLIQYTIAVDRGNEKIAYLYEPFHPGVLRLIKTVIENAHAASIPVGMCGEMAGDPIASVILLGLGLDSYSMSSVSIPEIKKIIRSVSMAQAEELVGTIMEMKSYAEIDKFVRKWMEERFDLITY